VKFGKLAAALPVVGCAAFFAGPVQAQNGTLPFDRPTVVDGVEAVCTGVGESDENNQRWATYPVKVVLAGKGGQYLGGAAVTIIRDGNPLATVTCAGPWTLFKVPPGRYEVSANLNGETQKETVYASQSGQGRVILRFLDRGGTVSPDHVPASQ